MRMVRESVPTGQTSTVRCATVRFRDQGSMKVRLITPAVTLNLNMLGMQSGTPRDARIFDVINIITNTYSCSIKAVDTRYGNII